MIQGKTESQGFTVDRWDLDLTHRCQRHGSMTDRYGDCLDCISGPDNEYQRQFREELKRDAERWAAQIRNYENAQKRRNENGGEKFSSDDAAAPGVEHR